MQVITVLCLVLAITVGAMCVGTTKNESDIKKNGNIFIADCYLSTMQPGEVKTEIISHRNTDPGVGVAPASETLYVRDGFSATEPPQPGQRFNRHRQSFFINNINRYTITIRKVLVDDAEEKRIIEIKPAETFRNVPQGTIPAYTIMGEKWDIFIDDCQPTNTEKIYVTDVNIAYHKVTVLESKSYNVEIENANDYDHCVIADAPCWPYEKRTIEVTATA